MGGNSLTGLDLLARLEMALGVRLPVATLFTHPTISDQALALARGRIPRQRSLVLRPGQKGGRTLFVIPGLGGDCLSLREMAEIMPPPIRLIVLLGQSESHWHSLEEIAAAFVQEALRLQSSGPYSLAGFSFGGKVAFEMAMQLGEQGRRIAHLMLIDSSPSLSAPRARGLAERLRWLGQRILFHWLTLRLLHPSRRLPHLKGALVGLWKRVRRRTRPRQPQGVSQSASFQHLLELGQRHLPGVFPGHVLLFQALFQPPHTPPANGWTSHCNSIEIQPVLGFHDADLVKRPWVETIVAKISSLLAPANDQGTPDQQSVRPARP
jgi:thioesterase domain-containing protein